MAMSADEGPGDGAVDGTLDGAVDGTIDGAVNGTVNGSEPVLEPVADEQLEAQIEVLKKDAIAADDSEIHARVHQLIQLIKSSLRSRTLDNKTQKERQDERRR